MLFQSSLPAGKAGHLKTRCNFNYFLCLLGSQAIFGPQVKLYLHSVSVNWRTLHLTKNTYPTLIIFDSHAFTENMRVSLYYRKEAHLLNETDDHELGNHKIGKLN